MTARSKGLIAAESPEAGEERAAAKKSTFRPKMLTPFLFVAASFAALSSLASFFGSVDVVPVRSRQSTISFTLPPRRRRLLLQLPHFSTGDSSNVLCGRFSYVSVTGISAHRASRRRFVGSGNFGKQMLRHRGIRHMASCVAVATC
jgi:hypothetical protein